MKTDLIDQEILLHLSNGLTTPKIAKRIFLSVPAVEKRIKVMRKRSGTKTVTELIAYALRAGIPGLALHDSF